MLVKKIEEIKKLSKEKNLFLYGFENPEKDVGDKVLKVVQYLFDGSVVVEGINYKLEQGWLFVTGANINEQKTIQLGFKNHITKEGEKGYTRKVFNNKNQFVFKIK